MTHRITDMTKPLGRKNYGSIGHLPSSRMGPSDRHVHEGQARICTEKARDRHDVIIFTEKLDGSNVGIANVDGAILALGRAGYLAQTSKYEQHQLFADWVRRGEMFWRCVVPPGHRLVGEWLAQVHGTRYDLSSPIAQPFCPFDIMVEDRRLPYAQLQGLSKSHGLRLPKLLSIGPAISVERAMSFHGAGNFNLLDKPEGVVYRVERKGEFDFMAKWVDPNKVDGVYLPEISGKPAVWNWRP